MRTQETNSAAAAHSSGSPGSGQHLDAVAHANNSAVDAQAFVTISIGQRAFGQGFVPLEKS